MSRVALVTGSNQGLGFALVNGLLTEWCAQSPQDAVYLTARDPARGQAAVTRLEKLGLSPRFHQLDVKAMPA